MEEARKERIWELDALRGLFILFVIIIHLIFDLQYFYEKAINLPSIYDFIQGNGGMLFILISGICITLGKRSIKRGLFVLGCGMLITVVTYAMFRDDTVYFGVLHLLGVCMMIYPLYKKLQPWAIALPAAIIIILGYYFETFYITNKYLFIFGLTTEQFKTGDYFPLFPHLGYFMLGVVMGKTLYKNKKSLLPKFPKDNIIIRFFRFCGRHSIWIYLIHQPVIYLTLLLLL